MAATLAEVNNYISSIRVGIADYTEKVCKKERLGHTDMFCNRQKVILLSAYLDCIVDYFNPFIAAGVDDGSYDTNNFFTTDEIKDVMQHVNNICGTFYIIIL
jgi:hypothetical protein